MKQYLASMESIFSKRAFAAKLIQEAEEELVEARLLLEDIEQEDADV